MLRLKFQLGLFENPYVDEDAAARTVGQAAFRAEGEAAQRRALVVLENHKRLLPLKASPGKIYLHGVSAAAARNAGLEVTPDLHDAQLALIRVETPHQLLHPQFPFGAVQHEGDRHPGHTGHAPRSAATCPE